jgi:hypothetical protein
MKRPLSIFGADLTVSLLIYAWYAFAPWISLYGFGVYHSRGDVWLPTPPAARAFFEQMVLAETSVFLSFFVAVSILALMIRSFPLRTAFYGGSHELIVKYSALLLSSIVLPYALHWSRLHGATREFYISVGLGLSLLSFILAVVLGNGLFALAHSSTGRKIQTHLERRSA